MRQKSEIRQKTLHRSGQSRAWWETAAIRYQGPSNGSRIAGHSMWFRFTWAGWKQLQETVAAGSCGNRYKELFCRYHKEDHN